VASGFSDQSKQLSAALRKQFSGGFRLKKKKINLKQSMLA